MIKRIISLVLVAVMLFSLMVTISAEDTSFIDKVISKLLQKSAIDRKQEFDFIKLQIDTDYEIDNLIVPQIRDFGPDSGGMLRDLIRSILAHTDKATAIKAVNSLKIVDENIRAKYLSAFSERETLKLSSSAMQALNYFISKACDKHNGLETLMQEDGITDQVIAKQLKAIVDINGGKPLFTDDTSDSTNFKIFTVSRDFKARADKFLSDYGMEGSSNIIDTYLAKLNNDFSTDEKVKIKVIGEAVGFYTPKRDVLPSGSTGGTGGGTLYQNDQTSIKYNVVEEKDIPANVELDGATVIEIALYKNDVKQQPSNLDKDYTIKIPVIEDSVMAYKITDSLTPLKYSVCINSELYIRINQAGYYAIKYMPTYFEDANGWGSTYIESLYNRGIINGKSEGIFAPESNITREEFVKLVVELFGLNDNTYYTNFADVNKDEWYYKYVAIAYKNGIINGIGDNRFGVGENITRQDMCKIITNVINIKKINMPSQRDYSPFNDDSNIDDYAKDSVSIMYRSNIISGNDNGYFNPKNNTTRQEAAKIIYGILEMYVKDTLN